MPTELSAHVALQDGLSYIGAAESGHSDAPAAAGGGAGLTPMELVLISLAGCSAMDVITVLRKKRQPGNGNTSCSWLS